MRLFRKPRPLVKYSAQVDRGLAIEFRWFGAMDIRTTWSPKRPKRIEGELLTKYRAARDMFLREIGCYLDGTPADIEAAIEELRNQQDALEAKP